MVSFGNKYSYSYRLFFISFMLFIVFCLLAFYDIKLALLVKTFILKSINNYKSPHIILYLFKNLSLVLAFLSCTYLTFLFFSTFNSFFTYFCYLIFSGKNKIRKFKIENIIFKGINWQLQKIGYILSPVIVTALFTTAIVLVGYCCFNELLFFTGQHFSFGVFSLNMAVFLMLLFLFSTPFISILLSVLCLYGTEIAITEPDITNKKIFLRSEKLFWQSKYNLLIAFLSCAFVFIIFQQVYYFIFEMDSIDFELFIAYLSFNTAFFVLLKLLKCKFYIKSLLSQYRVSLKNISL